MENIIVTKSLRRQLNQVIIHEQVENGVAINSNLSADKIDQQFLTLIKVYQFEQRHMWTEKRLASHITPQAALIILCEVQIGEA
jgi:hypothetical protein